MDAWTTLLTQNLLEAPLLVADLPEAKVLDRGLLGMPDPAHELNFRQKLGHVYEDALAGPQNGSFHYLCVWSLRVNKEKAFKDSRRN